MQIIVPHPVKSLLSRRLENRIEGKHEKGICIRDVYFQCDILMRCIGAIERDNSTSAAVLHVIKRGRSLHEHRHKSSHGLHVQLLQSGMAVGRESELWRTGVVSDGAYNLLRIIAGIFGRMAEYADVCVRERCAGRYWRRRKRCD
jgi:hypothetical protein